MSDETARHSGYPTDPNFSGAFAGGPPLISVKAARRVIEEPEAVHRELLARWEAMLQAEATESAA